MAVLHGEASSDVADRRRFNKPMPPPLSFFLVDRVLHLCAPPGRPWWRGGAAWRCGGFVAACSRQAMVARESTSAQPVLLLAGELALSGSTAASSSPLLPWRLGGDGFATGVCGCLRRAESSWEFFSGVLRRLPSAVTSGLKGVGHRSLCFDRRSLLLPWMRWLSAASSSDLEMKLLDRIAFCPQF
jgi:hypothetical protein